MAINFLSAKSGRWISIFTHQVKTLPPHLACGGDIWRTQVTMISCLKIYVFNRKKGSIGSFWYDDQLSSTNINCARSNIYFFPIYGSYDVNRALKWPLWRQFWPKIKKKIGILEIMFRSIGSHQYHHNPSMKNENPGGRAVAQWGTIMTFGQKSSILNFI